MNPLILPTRNVLAQVSDNDQRMIRWFESTTSVVTALAGAAATGGFLLDDGTATLDGGFLMDDGSAP